MGDGKQVWKGAGRLRQRGYGSLVLALLLVSACGQPQPTPVRLPTPTIEVRHVDAMPLMAFMSQVLAGESYRPVEEHRLERGLGWGEDTTRLSGFRTVFEGGSGAFSRVEYQVECYLTVDDAQDAYREYRQTMTTRLQSNTSVGPVIESTEEGLGDWNHKFAFSSGGSDAVHYIFLRENVLVELAFSGPSDPSFPDKAASQARVLDKQIYSR